MGRLRRLVTRVASLSSMHDRLIRLFREHFGTSPTAVLDLAGDGSTRSYRRLIGPAQESAIGAIGPDHEENRAFLSFSRAFREAGLPVPDVYAVDEEAGAYLLEDLGDTTLYDALENARVAPREFPESIRPLYRRVVEWLPRFQVEGDRCLDYAVAYPRPAFDRQSILWDLNYFKYHFLKLGHVPFNEHRLEIDFEALALFLLDADTRYFLYRDFQSRNVMLRGEEPWFIDYQGGRRGALQYDIASLLYDAKADLPPALRESLLQYYLECLAGFVPVEEVAWRRHYGGYVLVRVLQALGAYGYRGFFERKPRFLRSVPYAARNVEYLLEEGLPVQVPELEKALGHIVREWAGSADAKEGTGLTVHLCSFSYRRGYPQETGGHGGGFVFDCRLLPNPGRESRFQHLNGSSAPVAEFLDASPETERFWMHVRELVSAAVSDYVARGFTSLSVAFGCTGGQHRSVYLAERLSRHLAVTFPQVRLRTVHRERPQWPQTRDAAGAVG